MKYIDEFRNVRLVNKLSAGIKRINPGGAVNIMEVCGTHTQSFRRFNLSRLLPGNIRLISGPGCPVCVSPQGYIDSAIRLARNNKNIIVTFGDMLRIPGSSSSLEKEKAGSANVRVVYSPWEALLIAEDNPDKRIIFLAVGFETTAPAIALSVLAARRKKLKNIFFLSSLKLIPAAMRYLLLDKRVKIDAFLCPGHVSAIIGTGEYAFIPKKYGIACCVAGFEPVDMLEGIYSILKQLSSGKAYVDNQYKRLVSPQGNLRARRIIRQVFKTGDSEWRGIGVIPKSGLQLKKEFACLDAARVFKAGRPPAIAAYNRRCRCADVLKGIVSPPDCPLFARACKPDDPKGPCMVSSEGSCNVYYRYPNS